jgi:hypothetical protein
LVAWQQDFGVIIAHATIHGNAGAGRIQNEK